MRQVVRQMVEAVIRPVALRLGYSKDTNGLDYSEQIRDETLLCTFYSILKHVGFVPEHIVDVGANHGAWTRESLHHFPNSHYTLLEPQYWLKRHIQDILDTNSRVTFHSVGAGDKPGTYKFTLVDRDDSCSFQYSEAEATAKKFDQIDVPVVTLNEFIPLNNLPAPDIIKIDAEGFDLEVLKGSSFFFGQTEIFLVEASVMEKTYKNSVCEIISYMNKHGYRLFDITDINRPWHVKVLWLLELVFVKHNGVLDSMTWF